LVVPSEPLKIETLPALAELEHDTVGHVLAGNEVHVGGQRSGLSLGPDGEEARPGGVDRGQVEHHRLGPAIRHPARPRHLEIQGGHGTEGIRRRLAGVEDPMRHEGLEQSRPRRVEAGVALHVDQSLIIRRRSESSSSGVSARSGAGAPGAPPKT
jgi:hypothetical protein